MPGSIFWPPKCKNLQKKSQNPDSRTKIGSMEEESVVHSGAEAGAEWTFVIFWKNINFEQKTELDANFKAP